MDHSITIGNVLEFLGIVAAIAAVIGFVVWKIVNDPNTYR